MPKSKKTANDEELEITIRTATAEDVGAMWRLVHELATFEREPQEVITSPVSMLCDGFGTNPIYEAFVAALEDGTIVGTAIYFYTYSTWKGRTMYLDDIVITESYRRLGIGGLLFDAIIAKAKAEKVQRLSWQVLDWNAPAIAMYEKLGAEFLDEWITCRLTYEQLQAFPV